MGWNAFNKNKWRGENVVRKINDWGPSIFGAQEVEKGGYGYDEVKDVIKSKTSLAHAGGSQFFDDGIVEKLETGWTDLVSGSGKHFLFFNSHWKHCYSQQQAEIIVNAINAAREKYGLLPILLVGDTNQFCRGYESSAWKYLKGEI